MCEIAASIGVLLRWFPFSMRIHQNDFVGLTHQERPHRLRVRTVSEHNYSFFFCPTRLCCLPPFLYSQLENEVVLVFRDSWRHHRRGGGAVGVVLIA